MILTDDERKAAQKRQDDLRAYGDEYAGISTEMPRFFSMDYIKRIRDERTGNTESKRLAKRRKELLEEQARFMDRLEQLQSMTEAALLKARDREKAARELIELMRRKASLLPDGTAVYLTGDGKHAFTDDGRKLSNEEMKTVAWKTGAPTWEERQKAGEAYLAARREVEAIESYRERVNYYRQRGQGADLSEEELADMNHDLEAMPKAVRDELQIRKTVPPVSPEENGGHPDLFADFDLTADEIKDIKANPKNPGFSP